MLLLYAAGNPAKLPAMRSRLEVIGIHLLGLRDLGAAGKPLPSVVESGSAPSENARKGGVCYRGVPDAVLFPRFRLSRAVGIKWTPGAADRKGLASPGFPFTPRGGSAAVYGESAPFICRRPYPPLWGGTRYTDMCSFRFISSCRYIPDRAAVPFAPAGKAPGRHKTARLHTAWLSVFAKSGGADKWWSC